MKRLASLLVALALVGSPSLSRAAEPFSIYVDLPLTGQAAFIGTQTAKALAALEDYVNARGGIKGRPVKFVVDDDQSNPQIAVQNLNQFVSQKPAVIFGGTLAALCNASAGVVKNEGPVLYCYTPGVHPEPGSWIDRAAIRPSICCNRDALLPRARRQENRDPLDDRCQRARVRPHHGRNSRAAGKTARSLSLPTSNSRSPISP